MPLSSAEKLAKLIAELQEEGITDSRVLDAIRLVPRDLFVPAECRLHAFRNAPLPIGEGQTISQPFVVALMTHALALTGRERVLEIGTGSGYQCAVLAQLSGSVVSLERFPSLSAGARRRLAHLGYRNVHLVVGDGSLGHPPLAPYDAIIVTAASPRVPQPLVDQLAEGGRLVLPVGPQLTQELLLFVKQQGQLVSRQLGSVRFVPLVGEAGWKQEEVQSLLDEEW